MQFFFFFILSLSIPVFAYQTSLNSSGNQLFWINPSVPISIQTNTADMSSTQVRSIIQNSLNEWNTSSDARGTITNSSNNQIKFMSDFPYGSAVLGVTELSFNTSGSIQKASIYLNDDYYFHSSPGLYPTGEVFLGDVVTHELGHVFGLSHSEVLNSSMFYSSFSGQSSVSSDDRGGIRSKYGSGYGSITGHVKGGNSVGVLGVHVQAISRRTGEATSAISDENGYFSVEGLDLSDTYYIYTSSIKNPDSLPGYFDNVQNEFFPGTYVGSFYSSCGREFDGKPTAINLNVSNPSVDVGIISINCSLRSDQNYDLQKLQTTFSPVTIFDYGEEQRTEKSFVGWFRKSNSPVWSGFDQFRVDLTDYDPTSHYLKVGLVSYPFGSQVEYEMTIKQNGSTIISASKSMSYSSVTETYQTDFHSYLPLAINQSQNIFEVSIRARRLSASYTAQTFPSFLEFTSDQHLPYLITLSLEQQATQGYMPVVQDSELILSDNASCLDAPFTYPVSKTEMASESTSTSNDQTIAATGCGTIEPPRNGPPGPSLLLLTLGFLTVLVSSTAIKSYKKFLS